MIALASRVRVSCSSARLVCTDRNASFLEPRRCRFALASARPGCHEGRRVSTSPRRDGVRGLRSVLLHASVLPRPDSVDRCSNVQCQPHDLFHAPQRVLFEMAAPKAGHMHRDQPWRPSSCSDWSRQSLWICSSGRSCFRRRRRATQATILDLLRPHYWGVQWSW
jgi:hypothetical protein